MQSIPFIQEQIREDRRRPKKPNLENTLRDTNVVQRAHEALASMIEAVILRPDLEAQDGYSITLRGDCAGILGAYGGFQKEKLPEAVGLVGSQFSVVAGGRFGL